MNMVERDNTMRRALASYLLEGDRMVVEPSEEARKLFPLSAGNDVAWLNAAAELLAGAVEMRRPITPMGQYRLVVKDRAVLFNFTQERTLEDMAKDRKDKQNA